MTVQAGLIVNIGSIAGEMGMGRATRHAIAGAVLQQCCTDLVYAALYTHPHWLKQTLSSSGR